MKKRIREARAVWLSNDLPAGLSVFLVALPLCLGIALASGAPLYSGLLTGIIGGMVVALISGSQLAVSGPAAGLTTVVSASILSLGDYRIFLLAVFISGLFQLVLGILKFGTIANYFPSSVIKGMLAAIGIILISKQIPIALGYDQPDFWTSGLLNIFSGEHFLNNINGFNLHISKTTIFITTVSLAALIIFQLPVAKKVKFIPAPLIAVLLGILTNAVITNIATRYSLRQTQLVSIPNNIFSGITFPDFSKILLLPQIWRDGFIICLLASLETLLSIEAIDKLDKHNRVTPVNRELVAQGIGNMICGVLGAIPMTAVIVRGSANVDAGAKTKLSTFTHGSLLLLAVLFVPFLLNKIPYASLAAILLITGYNLTKPKLYRNMWRLGWKQFLPFIITIVVILVTDLLIGVSIGLFISVYYIIQNNFKAEYKVTVSFNNDVASYLIKLNSDVTFLNKVNLRKALDQIPEHSVLTIDGSESNFIDHDILEIISEFHTKAYDRQITLNLKGVKKVNIMAGH